MKLWIKIQTTLEVWGEAIKRWWDTHLCVISRSAARQIVMERDMLLEQIEELEDGSSTEIEKLTDETKYLKDELAYEHMRNKRLEDQLQTVRDRDYKDIYPGLQKENEALREDLEHLTEQFQFRSCFTCTVKTCEYMPDPGQVVRSNCPHYEGDDEVPTETSPEDS